MTFEHRIQQIMSGQAKGVLPALGRSALGVIEPFYRFAVGRRNRRYDLDASRARRLPRPVISVGNLTTGGTGKTPVIRWLAGALRDRGLNVAILARGYKAAPGTLGDEQRMLLAMLGSGVTIECDPDRHAAGLRALGRQPGIDLFLLDDGFQHRRLHRDLDIVLLHAAEPFGYGHVLPRGLLREPIGGLRRASVVVVTSADAATADDRSAIAAEVRRHQPAAPVLFERHAPTGLRSAAVASSVAADVPLAAFETRAAYCFSGLGSPGGFERQIEALSGKLVGGRRFPDHHAYTRDDVASLQQSARDCGADVLVTTEKDWVKLADIPDARTASIPIWRLDVEAVFEDGGDAVLLERVSRLIEQNRSSAAV